MSELTVTGVILIETSPARVWEVLTNTDYIRQWDDMPENFTERYLSRDSVIEWEGFSKMTVTEFQPSRLLTLDLFLPKVNLDPSEYDVKYVYRLSDLNGKAELQIEVGNFVLLPNSEDYYNASLEFVETAKNRRKELAEEGS